ncbi:MAG: hypothetical protein Q9195_006081 [Heterodermia aff. obscurata]
MLPSEPVSSEPNSSVLAPVPESKHEVSSSEKADDDEEPPLFSIFTPAEKRSIACLASFSAVFSTISSFIYFPAITALSKSLHVSIGAIHLTITSYFIVASIAPSIMGDMADQSGRRPISLLAFTLYLAANLGLASQNSYAALQTLRCVQSAAASGTVAIAYGVISDIAPAAERGSYVGLLLGLANAAPSLGPVLGGVIAEQLSWRWIFWMLAIASGVHLLLLFVFLPETARKVGGNGSRAPRSIIYQSLYHRLRQYRLDRNDGQNARTPSFRLPNPFSCLTTLFQRGTFIVILVGSLQSSLFNSIAASLSSQMIHIYSLTYLTAGLSYLPSGLGGAIAAYFTGKLLDRDFRIISENHSLPADTSTRNVSSFPIEKARLRSVFLFIAINTLATTGYGWALASRTHIAGPLIMLFLTGTSSAATFVTCGTLITDLNPDRSATVQASYNLIRCLTNAAGIAALQPLIDRVGAGWCFTIFGAIGALCIPFLLLLRLRGLAWRLGKG